MKQALHREFHIFGTSTWICVVCGFGRKGCFRKIWEIPEPGFLAGIEDE